MSERFAILFWPQNGLPKIYPAKKGRDDNGRQYVSSKANPELGKLGQMFILRLDGLELSCADAEAEHTEH